MTPTKEDSKSDQSAADFREEQKRKAVEQNQLADNAVPEQRPIAPQGGRPDLEHPVAARLRESGKTQDKPMPKSAYDKAASDEQEKKAERASKSESLRAGARVRITKGEYEGSYGAVVEVTYKNFEESQKAHSGDPGFARFAKVESVLVRTRGGRHALVSLKPSEVEEVDTLGLSREGEG